VTKKTFAVVIAALVIADLALIGCASPPPVSLAAAKHAHNAADHNHDRGRMMIASDGWVDALLTAHLSSKAGNELDVFVENKGEPLALYTTKLEATAMVRGEKRPLYFDCAPKDERPANEAEGTCSHFVARAGFITPEDMLRVEASLPLKTGDVPYVWRAFNPKKYAHHIE
jgi:hypothetical protein